MSAAVANRLTLERFMRAILCVVAVMFIAVPTNAKADDIAIAKLPKSVTDSIKKRFEAEFALAQFQRRVEMASLVKTVSLIS